MALQGRLRPQQVRPIGPKVERACALAVNTAPRARWLPATPFGVGSPTGFGEDADGLAIGIDDAAVERGLARFDDEPIGERFDGAQRMRLLAATDLIEHPLDDANGDRMGLRAEPGAAETAAAFGADTHL